MAKQRKKINKPKTRKPKPPTKKKVRGAQVTGEAAVTKYEKYTGPVVAPNTYDLFRSPLERANAKRREEAHRKGHKMYKAKTLIPEHNGVPEHYAWVDKFVQGPKIEEPKEVQNNGDNKSDAPGEISGVQERSDSAVSSAEAGA